MTTGTLTKNTDPHQKWSSSRPLTIGPMAPPAPANPAQMAMARGRSAGEKTLARMDSVDGITNAAPAPMSARVRDELVGGRGERRQQAGHPDHRQPELQGALATVAITQRAGRQQQAGEHQAVGVGDPLQLRLGGVQLAHERGQRHVERGVADHDHDEAEAQHGRG